MTRTNHPAESKSAHIMSACERERASMRSALEQQGVPETEIVARLQDLCRAQVYGIDAPVHNRYSDPHYI